MAEPKQQSNNKSGKGKGSNNNANKKKGGGNGGGGNSRSRADKVLAQGTGCTPYKPFGGSRRSNGIDMRVWDAKLPHHLPLPRAVGPYLTVRLTRRFSSTDVVQLFGTFSRVGGSWPGQWANVVSVSSVAAGSAINAISNTNLFCLPTVGLGDLTTLTPSALTVQVMNPNPIGSTAGIVYAGTMNTQVPLANESRTWTALADQFVEFQNPRILSAGKLALRGVQASGYPLNMSAVSDFSPLTQDADGVVTYSTAIPEPVGFTPIMVYNVNSVQLEYLVTTEFRVRFDLSNPASAGHVHHPVASDFQWDKLMKVASAMGNGVVDIAEAVANSGQAIPLLMKAGKMFL